MPKLDGKRIQEKTIPSKALNGDDGTLLLPYDSELTYELNDQIIFNGLLYIANQSVAIGETPITNPEKWSLPTDGSSLVKAKANAHYSGFAGGVTFSMYYANEHVKNENGLISILNNPVDGFKITAVKDVYLSVSIQSRHTFANEKILLVLNGDKAVNPYPGGGPWPYRGGATLDIYSTGGNHSSRLAVDGYKLTTGNYVIYMHNGQSVLDPEDWTCTLFAIEV
jgi:hypothetical protein